MTGTVIDAAQDQPHRGAPHLRLHGLAGERCRYESCDGDGWLYDDDTNTARPCRCRPERIAQSRARKIVSEIPDRYEHVDFDRWPLTNIDPGIMRVVRHWCHRLDRNLEQGRGLLFHGETGSGKTSMAMAVAKEALRERKSVAIFDGPELLSRIASTYDDAVAESYLKVIERLATVDLLILEDLAVAKQNEWRLEQLYTVVNRRYEDQRAMLVTADVASPAQLADHVGRRTASRIIEACEVLPFHDGDHRIRGTRPPDSAPEPDIY